MEKFAVIVLCTLGTVGLIVVAGLVAVTWALNQINREERRQYRECREHEIRNGLDYDDHDVSGLLEED